MAKSIVGNSPWEEGEGGALDSSGKAPLGFPVHQRINSRTMLANLSGAWYSRNAEAILFAFHEGSAAEHAAHRIFHSLAGEAIRAQRHHRRPTARRNAVQHLIEIGGMPSTGAPCASA